MTKIIDPSQKANIGFSSGWGEERKTPRAKFRPLDHGSTSGLRRHHLHLLALPNTKRVGHGLSLCRDQRSIVARAEFYQGVDDLQREKTICAACSRLKTLKKNHTWYIVSLFPFSPKSPGKYFKHPFQTSLSHLHMSKFFHKIDCRSPSRAKRSTQNTK